jgi:hypothetical protein
VQPPGAARAAAQPAQARSGGCSLIQLSARSFQLSADREPDDHSG